MALFTASDSVLGCSWCVGFISSALFGMTPSVIGAVFSFEIVLAGRLRGARCRREDGLAMGTEGPMGSAKRCGACLSVF